MRLLRSSGLRVSAIQSLFLLAVLLPPLAFGGEVVVTDGDGLRLNGKRMRLWGIDAPELGQECGRGGALYRCGEEAREVLGALLLGGGVSCETVDQDRYGRMVVRCMANGKDLAAEMVRLGWAVDYHRYSKGTYAAIEADARHHRRGLWAGEFENPAGWRARNGRKHIPHSK